MYKWVLQLCCNPVCVSSVLARRNVFCSFTYNCLMFSHTFLGRFSLCAHQHTGLQCIFTGSREKESKTFLENIWQDISASWASSARDLQYIGAQNIWMPFIATLAVSPNLSVAASGKYCVPLIHTSLPGYLTNLRLTVVDSIQCSVQWESLAHYLSAQ